MSDNIPFDIQQEIIESLPVKSLIRFRLVSKQWNTLITSSKFIADQYHTQQKHKHRLLVSYFDDPLDSPKVNYVSILDDDTFPQHKVSLTDTAALQLSRGPTILSSQGLLFVCHYKYLSSAVEGVIWNPTIRRSVQINLRGTLYDCFGFGVCPHTYDPKIVRYRPNTYGDEREVEIFTLRTNAWRRLHNNLPRACLSLGSQVTIDRFMYWSASDTVLSRKLIVSFDMTSEEFTEIYYPASLAACRESSLYLKNIRDSLVVVQDKSEAKEHVYSIWKMMEQGLSKSFTKLYTINTTDTIYCVHGFRKSGEPIVTVNNPKSGIFAYDPDSKHINYVGFPEFYCVHSYIETLLLL